MCAVPQQTDSDPDRAHGCGNIVRALGDACDKLSHLCPRISVCTVLEAVGSDAGNKLFRRAGPHARAVCCGRVLCVVVHLVRAAR